MRRKVFISFLGTGKYKECVYTYKNEQSKVVKYVQTATIDLLAENFDKYFVFCTAKASETHFEKLNEEAKDILNREGNDIFEKKDIPDGTSEDEIWKIFQIVFDTLEEGDKVIFDVTHSFRSIPMLGITLLQYAKFIKKIEVVGIYYGAFEKLGKPFEIDKNYPNAKDRKVPILNLTSFSVLQDWSNYGSQFITTGNAKNLLKITSEAINPILNDTKGKNLEAQNFKKIKNLLSKLSEDFNTNRGKEFYEGSTILQIIEEINQLEGQLLPPFNPILDKLKKELECYKKNDSANLFYAVKWCIDKDLIQQGITQLQEAVITLLCKRLNRDTSNLRIREIISSYLRFGINQPVEKWKPHLTTELGKSIIADLKTMEHIIKIAKAYDGLSDKRNDINHGGYADKSVESKKFKNSLVDSYNKLKKLL